MPSPAEIINERLERFRKKLLDTSRRNKLVNFRSHSKTGGKPVEKVVVVVGEDPVKVFRDLVSEPKSMTFIGLPDRQQSNDGELLLEDEFPDDSDFQVDQDDNKLSTRLTKTRLDRHLTKIRRDQVEMIEEQGINALFLTIGQLRWQEAENSSEIRIAPLVLIPVLLERTDRGGFKLKWDSTEIGSNLSLGALLREEFRIELPVIESDEVDILDYFDKAQATIANQTKWTVDRNAIALGFFSFAKYLIYKDLSPASWPEHRDILKHSVLAALLESGFVEPAESLPGDIFLDDHRTVGETNEVFDADGSQTLAILQALQGSSMVIEGPPGTGKSQTIANLIAEFVGQGKKVLFVSEKNAALNVVYDRLKNAELANACLEIHGTKANKRNFYQNLKETMEGAAPRLIDAQATLRKLSADRNELNTYVHHLHKPLDVRLTSPRQAIGRLVQLGLEEDVHGRIDRACVSGWPQSQFDIVLEKVKALQSQLSRIGVPIDHPFYGAKRPYISPDDKSELARIIESTLESFKLFREETRLVTERLHVDFPDDLKEVESLEDTLGFVISSPKSNGVSFDHRGWYGDIPSIRNAIAAGKSEEDLRIRLCVEIKESSLKESVDWIRKALDLPGDIHVANSDITTWGFFDEIEKSTNEVIRHGSQISQLLNQPMPTALWAMEPLAALASRISKAPILQGLDITSPKWRQNFEEIENGIALFKSAVELKRVQGSKFKLIAWETSVEPLITVLERDGRSFFRRLFSKDYKASRQRSLALLSNETASTNELFEALHTIQNVQKIFMETRSTISLLKNLYEDQWQGEESDFTSLATSAEFLSRIHGDVEAGKISAQVFTVLNQQSTLQLLSTTSSSLRQSVMRTIDGMQRLHDRQEELKPGFAVNLTGDPIERTYKFFTESIRDARQNSEELWLQNHALPDWSTVVSRLNDCEKARKLANQVFAAEALMSGCLGGNWANRAGNWAELSNLVEWVIDFSAKIASGELPRGLVRFFEERSSKDGLDQTLIHLRKARKEYSDNLDKVSEMAELDGGSESFLQGSFDDQRLRIDGWASNVDELEDYFRYNSIASDCESEGLSQLVTLSSYWPPAKTRLGQEFERAWCNQVVDEAMNSRPILRSFDRKSHEEMIASFQALDRSLIQINRVKVSAAHFQGVPRTSTVGEVGFIRLQMNRQRGHRPIRVAMTEAPSAIQAIKPVFLMSPLSVAMYLPPSGPLFDVVIFDEASQIKPEDALGSVVRAKQIIVVGDTKQMPPTSIFDRLTSGDGSDEDEGEDIETNDIAEQESILAFASFRIPEGSSCRRDLRWHYRSRHDSLIKTSNRLFYKDRLIIFPHSTHSGGGMGLVFRHNPATIYGRGNSRKNELEAAQIAQAALKHVQLSPDISLGIVAFSKAQQEAIEDQIDLLRKQDPAFAEFDERHGHGRLFVKNLESVQGDERDVIFISIGYGRDENGFLGMNFGSLNNEGGERRLNVLITRSRLRIEVFSNFRAAEMRIGETKSKGVHALHTFLAFAESGHLDVSSSILPMEPSYFEELVYEKLSSRGYDIDKQVGSENFYIDMAVRHRSEPGRYALGIECDGAMYHSAKAARDRDRLRQQVLEDRGWNIYRIWSTDWWRHPERELNRCCEAIELSFSGGSIPTSFNPQAEVTFDPEPAEETIETGLSENHSSASTGSSDYHTAMVQWPASIEILEMPISRLGGFVHEVVIVESPIHIDEVIRRIREAAGKGKAGRLIRDRVFDAIANENRRGTITVIGEFVHLSDQAVIPMRSRSSFRGQVKRLDLIAPEEIFVAITHVLRHAVAILPNDIAKPVCDLFGFDRVTVEMENHVNSVVNSYIKNRSLELQNGKIYLSSM